MQARDPRVYLSLSKGGLTIVLDKKFHYSLKVGGVPSRLSHQKWPLKLEPELGVDQGSASFHRAGSFSSFERVFSRSTSFQHSNGAACLQPWIFSKRNIHSVTSQWT